MEKVILPEEGSLPKTVPAWATTGKTKNREHNVITSLFMQPEEMEQVNLRMQEKYKSMQTKILPRIGSMIHRFFIKKIKIGSCLKS